jgi:hypothetical protein
MSDNNAVIMMVVLLLLGAKVLGDYDHAGHDRERRATEADGSMANRAGRSARWRIGPKRPDRFAIDRVRSESQPVRQNRASPRHHRVLRRGRTATQAPEIDLTPPPDHATASRSKGIDKVRAGTVRAPLARAQRRWRCATAPGCLAWIESAGLPGVRSGRLASIRECATGLADAPVSVARVSLHAS